VIKTSSHRRFTLAVLVLAIVVVNGPAHDAQTFSVLYNFGSTSGGSDKPPRWRGYLTGYRWKLIKT
jgi:hypothetical protein